MKRLCYETLIPTISHIYASQYVVIIISFTASLDSFCSAQQQNKKDGEVMKQYGLLLSVQ